MLLYATTVNYLTTSAQRNQKSKIKKTIVKSSTRHWNVTPGNAITCHPPKKFKKQKKNSKIEKRTARERERREKARRSARKNQRIFTQTALLLSDQIGQSLPPSLHVYRLGFSLYFIKFPLEFLKIF